ncbi:MAG: hypothetical protein OXU71_05640 [Gammaproteobacteria bacterium]|nr:hypothetical protein [Gammaproteobacteria bacterium]
MKLQYLGDSKDAFKWDYLDFLARKMEMDLHVIPMLTPDDGSGQGSTPSSLFPASGDVDTFCDMLRECQKLERICKLPQYTGGCYEVQLHKPTVKFCHSEREEYFSTIEFVPNQKQIVFLDPDIGFQPARSTPNEKHVKYSDMEIIWSQIHEESIVVVFQHGRLRFVPFCEHYKEIRDGLNRFGIFHSTALFWSNKLMFVAIGKSSGQIKKVHNANIKYQKEKYQRKGCPVLVIGAP